MFFTKIIKAITEAFMVSGYSSTAKELRKLSDRQLADIGVSRRLLLKGAKAYPWREELVSQEIPATVTYLKTKAVVSKTPVMPYTPKAA